MNKNKQESSEINYDISLGNGIVDSSWSKWFKKLMVELYQ